MRAWRQLVSPPPCAGVFATGLSEYNARALRDILTRQAPDPLSGYDGTTIQHPDCWLLQRR